MLISMSSLRTMFGGQRPDETIRSYVTRLASRPSLGPVFVPAAFRGVVDLYWRTDDLNARIASLEAEVARLRGDA